MTIKYWHRKSYLSVSFVTYDRRNSLGIKDIQTAAIESKAALAVVRYSLFVKSKKTK